MCDSPLIHESRAVVLNLQLASRSPVAEQRYFDKAQSLAVHTSERVHRVVSL